MKLPYELSGAMSKNRFRSEILWGLTKVFEVYISGENFVAIFDYVCDIEIHTDHSLNFYQVKTQKSYKPYSLNTILKKNKEHSILGKLYLLKVVADSDKNMIRLAVVSNSVLQGVGNKIYSDSEKFCFDELEEKCRSRVIEKMGEEFPNIDSFDLHDIYYIRSTVDLFKPEESLIGKTALFYKEVTGTESKKTITLYNVLSETVNSCAAYELASNNYDELILNKGITRDTIDSILKEYSDEADIAVNECINEINNYYKKINERSQWKKFLTESLTLLEKDKFLQSMEKEISEYINDNIDNFAMDTFEAVSYLQNKFKTRFTIEYEETLQSAFILLIIKRYEEGLYE